MSQVRMAVATITVLGALLTPGTAHAQADSGRVRVVVRAESRPLGEAEVRSGRVRARTDRAGAAVLHLPTGPATVTVAHLGFHPETLQVAVPAGSEIVAAVTLREQ